MDALPGGFLISFRFGVGFSLLISRTLLFDSELSFVCVHPPGELVQAINKLQLLPGLFLVALYLRCFLLALVPRTAVEA